MDKNKLTAEALKKTLWETLNDIKDGTIDHKTGNAVASQAREILRAVNIQLKIAHQTRNKVSSGVVDFAKD